MVEKRELLEKRLENVKKQIKYNIAMAVIAILILIFVPIVKFENFVFQISIETIIAFILLIVAIGKCISLRTKKEDIEAELSVYSEEKIKEEKKEAINEPEHYCEYCDKEFKSEEALQNHYEHCEAKEEKAGKNRKIVLWMVGIMIFLGLGINFLINNKINLIPLVLIGFIITPFFDKAVNWCKKKNKNLEFFEFKWWKKFIFIGGIILLFVLINLVIPECPLSCDDDNRCTNDFCNAETGFKCMNTIKLSCNGNGICESGEYGKSSDCPDCDDGNNCTADSYDSASKKCIHVEMKGCVK